MNKIIKKEFFKHNEPTLKVPITRTSAVFYFMESNQVSTQIHFMNYWLEKRNNQDILLKISIRAMSGLKLFEHEKKIFDIGAHIIHLKDILKMFSSDENYYEGSIELEFFSKQNLFIPFPALVVRYIGKNWHTSAHSTQRHFSIDSGDTEERINDLIEAEEGNITIHDNKNYEPFFIIHNGKRNLNNEKLLITITSKSGKEIISSPIFLDWSSFQTRVFNLTDLINFRSFLEGEIGTFRVKFTASGIFARIIAGYRSPKDGHWSIDHTNFAAKEGTILDDVFETFKQPSFKNLVFNVPNNFDDNWECYSDIYPTSPVKGSSVEINCLDPYGEKIKSTSLLLNKESENAIQRIECNEKHNYELIFFNKKALPRRFHVGVQYKIKSGNYGFLTDGPIPHDANGVTTRWMPLFDSNTCKNYMLIANRTLGDNSPERVKFTVKLFNSFGDKPILSNFNLEGSESKSHNIANLFDNYETYLNGSTGWLYLTSETPNHCVIHYASVKSDNNIACDHAF